MANHAKPLIIPAKQPEPPRIEWAQIQRVGDLYHLVRIVTQGERILEQHVDKGHNWRPVIEMEFQRWAVDHVLDRKEGP